MGCGCRKNKDKLRAALEEKAVKDKLQRQEAIRLSEICNDKEVLVVLREIVIMLEIL